MADDLIDDRLREDAVDALRDALEWWHRRESWVVVAAVVVAVRRALVVGDAAAVRAAVHKLEGLAPTRGVGFDEEPAQVPDDVRIEINELIHTLDGREAGD